MESMIEAGRKATKVLISQTHMPWSVGALKWQEAIKMFLAGKRHHLTQILKYLPTLGGEWNQSQSS